MYNDYAEPRLSQEAHTIKPLLSKVSKGNIRKHIKVLSKEPRDTPERQD